MQDRFRFRVWFTPDYQEPEMIYDAEQTYDNRCRNKGSFHHESFGEILEDKDCIVMQCTGLKDKNGKLIYEGDILRSEEYPFKNEESYNYAAEVLWDDASATFYYYTFRISTNVVGRAEGNTGNLNDYEWEVIGNIYENPELLEE
jgi:uncharacterized phage protein (TIGR01671 family)